MATCEWCWARAYGREWSDASKSQAEHYRDLLAEQEAKGADAECPTAREAWQRGRTPARCPDCGAPAGPDHHAPTRDHLGTAISECESNRISQDGP